MHLRIASMFVSCIVGIAVGIGVVVFVPDESVIYISPVGSVLFQKPYRTIGFLPFWLVSKTDTTYKGILTDIVYFGLTLESDGTLRRMERVGEQEPGFTLLESKDFQLRLNEHVKNNQRLSLSVHLSDEQKIFELLEQPDEHGALLVTELEPFIRSGGFSDVNLDIESFSAASQGAQLAFTRFVRAVKKGMSDASLGTLSLDVAPISLIKPRIINVNDVAPFVDTIILMTYDYSYTGSFFAGPVAPLGGAGSSREFDVLVAVARAVESIHKDKIILGQPLYGYEWDTHADFPGAPTVPGTGKTASNRRIAELRSTCTVCTVGRDTESNEAYLIMNQGGYYSQIFYEDSVSLEKKVQLVKKYGLGGIAFWALGYEDVHELRVLPSLF